MRRLTMIVFVIALVIVAYETFLPTPPFPSTNTSFVTGALQIATGLVK
ncbi:hypothetical protein LLE49_15155 [Alicyclobacillus tolerans]|nr:hypothetical protein [Alicyclobacillus tolerans]MCF8566062.1 hypothetical protein [Alicyclobacillus tolerans]